MHPPPRHKRSQSSKDLDDAVSKLEHARDVLLDAKVKTNEALSKAASTFWQRECRRAPRPFAPDHSLTALVIRSRPNSPTGSPRNGRPHNSRTLAISAVRTQAHITHQSVVYSPKLKRLEINQTLNAANTRRPLEPMIEHLNLELTQSIEHKIRRRHQQLMTKTHQQIHSSKSSEITSESETSSCPETAELSKRVELMKTCTASASHKPASGSEANSTISSLSKSSDRRSTLSDIRAMLQNLEERLYFVPAANVKLIKQELPDSSSLSRASSIKQCDVVRGDLKYLESNTRDVLRALSKRYKR